MCVDKIYTSAYLSSKARVRIGKKCYVLKILISRIFYIIIVTYQLFDKTLMKLRMKFYDTFILYIWKNPGNETSVYIFSNFLFCASCLNMKRSCNKYIKGTRKFKKNLSGNFFISETYCADKYSLEKHQKRLIFRN